MKKMVSLLLAILILASVASIPTFAATKYTINGKTVTCESSSVTNNCWSYAQDIYKLLWNGRTFSSSRETDDDLLRKLSKEQITLTTDHLKAYISAAPLGSVIRICSENYVDGGDGKGHSQILVARNQDGFTVLQSNMKSPKRQETTYTWETYVNYWNSKKEYKYIKYIKAPGVAAYQPAGWVRDSVGWWYRNADGTYPKANWAKIDGRWYHFDSRGYAQKGWYLDTDGNWYYLDSVNCWMLTGWQYDTGTKAWYYLYQDGHMASSTWCYDENYSAWYYLKASGAMATGETLMIGAVPYTFDTSGKWVP